MLSGSFAKGQVARCLYTVHGVHGVHVCIIKYTGVVETQDVQSNPTYLYLIDVPVYHRYNRPCEPGGGIT